MANSIKLDSVQADTVVCIRGKVSFSKITAPFEGKALADRNARAQQKGMTPIDKPYTTLTLTNAFVVYKNANQPTLIEQWAEGALKIYAKNPAAGKYFTGINKGNNLPLVAVVENGKATEVQPKGELANGLDVTLMMRVFQSNVLDENGNKHNGIYMHGILVNEPIRYYNSGKAVMADALKAYGITFVSMNSQSESATNESETQAEDDELDYSAYRDTMNEIASPEYTQQTAMPYNASDRNY